jgi:hypothetical protein
MGRPKFRIEYTPQQKKSNYRPLMLDSIDIIGLQARCAFCKKHFKQNKLRIGTHLPNGAIQWRHANRKCRAWQYVLSRVNQPEEFDNWSQAT